MVTCASAESGPWSARSASIIPSLTGPPTSSCSPAAPSRPAASRLASGARHGGFAHHLLDPSTGHPAWTGLVQATSLGTTALEAETLAKMAFLAGPEGAPEILSEHGGLMVLDDGGVELCGSLAERPRDRAQAVAA